MQQLLDIMAVQQSICYEALKTGSELLGFAGVDPEAITGFAKRHLVKRLTHIWKYI